ncbi:MAG: hypothetical protein DRQ58_10905 [Gammaproteobacteria bacterium]|nr:MAG: hypothetical protein DRQ58_10905 [Gammaproteobacteria bacterium]
MSTSKKFLLGVRYNIKHIGGNYRQHIADLLTSVEGIIEKALEAAEFVISMFIVLPVFIVSIITFPIKLLILSPIKGSKMTDEKYEEIINELK